MSPRISRRTFVSGAGIAAGAGAAGALSGCGVAARALTQPEIPTRLALRPVEAGDPVLRVLNRTAFGPRPGDIERVRRMGIDRYLEDQLQPGKGIRQGPDWLPIRLADTPAVEARLGLLDTLQMDEGDLLDIPKEQVRDELQQAAVIRAVYSRWQLREVMVEFWNDHFNVSQTKGDSPFYKTPYDAQAIRANALGRFRDLLAATARSPAMLYYLDNARSDRRVPNENYARELMELHTLGVDGGYSQSDVVEVARCFTGWSIRDNFWRGQFEFRPHLHDPGDKRVLGRTIRGRSGAEGIQEGEEVLDLLAVHASTARFIARKLCRRFVADEPPPGLVERLAGAFGAAGGHIGGTTRALFASDEFRRGPGPKMKRPFDFVIAALRGLNANTDGVGPLAHLQRMGQLPFQWAMPNGYPDVASAWSASLLGRWNFALALATGSIAGTSVDLRALAAAAGVEPGGARRQEAEGARRLVTAFAALLVGQPLGSGQQRRLERLALATGGSDPVAPVVAALLASPECQMR